MCLLIFDLLSLDISRGKNDWKGAMAYDVCVKDTFDNVQVAVGLRYIDAHKSYMPHRLCLYASFGFTLDLK